MKKAIFPGCVVLGRFQEYEFYSRKILQRLGYWIVELDDFCCCGASLLPGVSDRWINLTAYSLALAERLGAGIVTLCGNCTQNFRRANLCLETEPGVRNRVGSALKKLGLEYSGNVTVRHFIEILAERENDVEALCSASGASGPCSDRQAGVKVALSYPCQVLRPANLREGVPDPREALKNILKKACIETVDFPAALQCCGAAALLFDENTALKQARKKLRFAKEQGAGAVCAACGNCMFLLDRFQHKVFEDDPGGRMRVISISELLYSALRERPEPPAAARREAFAGHDDP